MNWAAVFGISWATPIFILAGYGLFRFFIRQPETKKQHGINLSPFETAAITLALYFVSQFIGTLLLFSLSRAFHSTADSAIAWIQDTLTGQFLYVLFVDSIIIALLLNFLKRRKAGLQTLGLVGKPRWKDAGYALMGFGVYFLIYVILVYFVKSYIPAVDVEQEQQIGFKAAEQFSLVFAFIALVILPAMVEEIVMRGFLYSGLKNGLHIVWAAGITSLVFAAAHLQAGSGEPLLWIAAIDTFILSLVLIYLKEKTGRLWAPIGLHMLKNGLTFLFLFVLRVG